MNKSTWRVICLSYLGLFLMIWVYWWFASYQPESIELGHSRFFFHKEDHNVFYDMESGFLFSLPLNTRVIDNSKERTIIARGYAGKPDYRLYISTETYDPRIPTIQYLAAQQEGAFLRGPLGSELVFSQMFDQDLLTGVQAVYVRQGQPFDDVEEVFIFAHNGQAVFLRFQYPLSLRDMLEPEMVWVRSTLEFITDEKARHD